MMLLAPIAATIIQLMISRSREYAADRLGAQIAGDPLALASALAKIENAATQIPNPQAESHPATAPLFIINPLIGGAMDNLFSTHPSTPNRIAALQELAGAMSPRRSALMPRQHRSLRRSPWGCYPPGAATTWRALSSRRAS